MKIFTLVLIAVLSFSANTVTGQTQSDSICQSDSIKIEKGLGTYFIYKGQKLTPKQLLHLTEGNSAAYEEMRTAKTNNSIANAFAFAGGFLVGWPVGTVMGGGDPNWVLAGVGAGLIVVSIRFSSAYTRHAKNAVNIYNSGIKTIGRTPDISFRAGFTRNGIGLIMTF